VTASSQRPRSLHQLRTSLSEGGENFTFLKLDVADEASALPGKLGPSPTPRGSPYSGLKVHIG
jgi:hypothetical protein